MYNLNQPASPFVNYMARDIEDSDNSYGFTKLEKAALMIAQGLSSRQLPDGDSIKSHLLAEYSVELAKAVLEEANK